MRRDDVLAVLRRDRDELRALGVASLALFGSVARDEARDDSDVDVMVEFDGPVTFDRYMDVKLRLEDALGRKVDLVTRAGLRPTVRPGVEREAVRVA